MPGPLATPSRISQSWLLLAVLSLGLSAVAAVVLVLARTPVLNQFVAPDTFPRALVLHVNLATLIWYFSMAGAFWTESLAPRPRRVLAAAFGISVLGAAGVVTSGFLGAGNPVLANYVPYLTSPLFLGALAMFACGTVTTAAMTIRPPRDAAEWGFLVARWPFLMGAAYLLIAARQGQALPDVLWGVGHVLQFGFVTLLMAIWLRLAGRAGLPAPTHRLSTLLFAATAAPATLAPLALLAGAYNADSLHALHTAVMRWGNWPGALLLGMLLLRDARGALRVPTLVPSLALFMIGILAGSAIDSQTTMIPAHYHGTIGAFTLAQMAAVIARLSPAGGKPSTILRAHAALRIYAIGIILLIAGLAWSGLLGIPRKTGYSADGADLTAALAAGLTGVGGAITIAGVATFVFLAVPRILTLCKAPPSSTSSQPSRAAGAMFAAAH